MQTPNGVRTAFDDNEAYDPKTNTWRKLAALPSARHGIGAVAVGNTLYFLGGSTECGSGGKLDDNLAFTLPYCGPPAAAAAHRVKERSKGEGASCESGGL